MVDNASTDRTAEIALASCKGRPGPRAQHRAGPQCRGRGRSGRLARLPRRRHRRPGETVEPSRGGDGGPELPGGAADTDYRPARFLIKIYLRMWRMLGQCLGMVKGPAFLPTRRLLRAGGLRRVDLHGRGRGFLLAAGQARRARGQHLQYLRDVRSSPRAGGTISGRPGGSWSRRIRSTPALPAPPRRLARLVQRNPPLTVRSRGLNRRAIQ